MFKTLDDLKGKKEDKKDPKAKQTTSYTGGEKSGLAVENPDDINGILQQADRAGDRAERAERPERGERRGEARSETNCKVTLYQNGFTVNDGEFRDYNSPENKAFMAELNQRKVPRELHNQYPQGLSVGLEDRRSEKFRLPTPPKYIAFSGKGVSLGDKIVGKIEKVDVNSVPPPKVDESKPKTTVQLRLHNGETVRLTLNTSTRVEALFTYVLSVAPVDRDFELVSGFPPRAITNVRQTLEEADLLDSTVIQRLR